jgi:phage shock protein PspC (stress-responsive transcriptional regulator)
MERKIYPYSLKSKDSKILGVCSTLGQVIGIDPTFLRLGFVAAAIFISFQWTFIAYAAIGLTLAIKKKQAAIGNPKMSDFDRIAEAGRRKPSIKSMREDLDVNDRRMMAIDHHLNTHNDELAREIEALREDK